MKPFFFRRLVPAALLVGLLIASSAGSSRSDRNDPVFRQIGNIVATISSITGLEQKHAVPYGRMSQDQLRHFLSKRMKSTLKPKELHANELTLKLFGLVPENFDLKQSTLDLLTEQAAAFYDYRAKRLFLLDSASAANEQTTLAHELAHALADQYFNLEKYVDDENQTDDENLARTAVVEGQASWIMLAFQRHIDHLDGPPTQQQIAAISDAADGSSPDYPVLQSSPLYIQQSLLFPYTEGARFFNAVYAQMGKAAFREVFSDPPTETAQIYHPDRYYRHVPSPELPELPKLQLKDGQSELTSGNLGEFDHRMLIWQTAGRAKANRLAPHVRSGVYRVLEAGRKHHRTPVLQYLCRWDTDKSAEEYFAVYKRALRKKSSKLSIEIDRPNLFAGTTDTGYFVMRLNGVELTSVEGLRNKLDWQNLLPLAGLKTAEWSRRPVSWDYRPYDSPETRYRWRAVHGTLLPQGARN